MAPLLLAAAQGEWQETWKDAAAGVIIGDIAVTGHLGLHTSVAQGRQAPAPHRKTRSTLPDAHGSPRHDVLLLAAAAVEWWWKWKDAAADIDAVARLCIGGSGTDTNNPNELKLG